MAKTVASLREKERSHKQAALQRRLELAQARYAQAERDITEAKERCWKASAEITKAENALRRFEEATQ